MRKMEQQVKYKEVNVIRIYILFLLLCCAVLQSQAQNKAFILLEQPTTEDRYAIKQVKLNSKSLYKVDYEVEMYNIIFPKDHSNHERIVLFSILPDFKSNSLWTELQDSSAIKDAKRLRDLDQLFMPPIGYNTNMNLKRKFFHEFYLVKEENGKYFQANVCLMELFEITSMNPRLLAPYGLLNLQEAPLKLADYLKIYPQDHPQKIAYPFHLFGKNYAIDFTNGWRSWKEYLSKEIKLADGVSAYQFWTAASSNVADYPDISRGIERFIYIPGTGIIAGSYDFHFYRHENRVKEHYPDLLPTNKLSENEWNSNVINERTMIASGYEDKFDK